MIYNLYSYKNNNKKMHDLQTQQKNLGQPVNCSYSPGQRNLQPLFPSSANSGYNHRDHSKATRSNMQQKVCFYKTQPLETSYY